MEDIRARGVASFNAGRFEEAARLFGEAVDAGDRGPGTQCFLAHALAACGRVEEAVSRFAAATAAAPRHLPAYAGLSALVLRLCPARSAAAEKALRALLRVAPGGEAPRAALAAALRGAGEALRAAGDLEGAEASHVRALSVGGSAADRRRLGALLRLRADAELAAGRPEAAARELRRALAVDPADAAARRALAAILRRRGLAHVAAGRLAQAEAALRRAVELAPADASVRRGLADVRRMGRLSAAARRAEAERAAAARLRGLRRRGLAELSAGRLGSAEARTRRAVAASPADRESWRQLEEIIALRRQARDSKEREAAARRGERLRALLENIKSAGRLYSPAARAAAARRTLRRVEAAAPGHARAHLLAGGVLLGAGEAAEGRRLLRRGLALDDGSLDGAERFVALMRLGRHREAVALGESLLDGRPTLDELRAFWDPWGWEARRDDERRAELGRLARAVPRGEKSPWTVYYRADLRGPGEREALERLGRLPPGRYGWMLAKAGLAELCAGRFAAAAARLRSALRWRSRDWRTRGMLAEALLCLGRRDEAFAQLDRARPEAPPEEAGQVVAWRGLLDLWLGRYAPALERFDEALRLGAPYAAAWRGAALLKLGRPREALAQLDAALAGDPLDLEAYVWRAEAKRALGLAREALADLAEPGLAGDGRATPVWLWALVNRALAKGELGDRAGLEADFALLPRAVVEFVREKTGKTAPKDLLEAALELARGFRREEYAQAIWMS